MSSVSEKTENTEAVTNGSTFALKLSKFTLGSELENTAESSGKIQNGSLKEVKKLL
jgi:hypothetical protein